MEDIVLGFNLAGLTLAKITDCAPEFLLTHTAERNFCLKKRIVEESPDFCLITDCDGVFSVLMVVYIICILVRIPEFVNEKSAGISIQVKVKAEVLVGSTADNPKSDTAAVRPVRSKAGIVPGIRLVFFLSFEQLSDNSTCCSLSNLRTVGITISFTILRNSCSISCVTGTCNFRNRSCCFFRISRCQSSLKFSSFCRSSGCTSIISDFCCISLNIVALRIESCPTTVRNIICNGSITSSCYGFS